MMGGEITSPSTWIDTTIERETLTAHRRAAERLAIAAFSGPMLRKIRNSVTPIDARR